jgi:hypothetical protein
VVPAGWTLTNLSCTDPTNDTTFAIPTATINLATGENVTCTFTNTKKASVTIKKETTGGTGTFTFDATTRPAGQGAISFTETTPPNPSAGEVLTSLVPGTYTFTETPPAVGWILTDLDCDAGTGISNASVSGLTGTFTLAPGATGTCTFKNTLQQANNGTIVIRKVAAGGDGATPFNFTATGGLVPANFSLTPPADGPAPVPQTFANVTPGAYSVTETAVAGWTTAVQCTDPTNNTTTAGSTASINVAAGETVDCTFTNTRQTGSITIEKQVVGGTGGETFDFSLTNPNGGNVALPDSSLGDGESTTVASLPTGSPYTITETVPAGWTLTVSGAGCTQNGSSATVTVQSNTQTHCVFTNTRRTGSLRIKKVTIGGNGSFDFTVTGQPGFSLSNGQSVAFADIPTGSYTITEVNLPSGWTLQSASCSESVTKNGNAVIVSVDSGDDISCTFTNFKERDDPMDQVTQLFVHRRVDNLLTYGPDRSRLLRRMQADGGSSGTGGTSFASPASLAPPRGGQTGSAGGLTANPLGDHSQAFGFGTGLSASGALSIGGAEGAGEVGPYANPSGSGTIVSHVASKLMPLAGSQSSFKFGTSLSEMRAVAAQAAASEEQRKLAEAGLGYQNQPFNNPLLTMRQGLDFFVEGHIGRYEDDTAGFSRQGDFRILYIGADYSLAPNVLIGALVQIDDTREDVDNSELGNLTGNVEGTGWMAGPYVGLRLANNLYFDARTAYGTSENDIRLSDDDAGYRSGSFDTDRWLATATLTGSEYFGAWRISPQIGLAYGREWYDDYRNSLGQLVEGRDISIGRLTGAAEIGYKLDLSGGTVIEPHVSLTGIWNFATDKLELDGATDIDRDESRAKVEGGVLVLTPSGWSMRAAAAYDGIGSDDFEAYSGSVWVNVPLN